VNFMRTLPPAAAATAAHTQHLCTRPGTPKHQAKPQIAPHLLCLCSWKPPHPPSCQLQPSSSDTWQQQAQTKTACHANEASLVVKRQHQLDSVTEATLLIALDSNLHVERWQLGTHSTTVPYLCCCFGTGLVMLHNSQLHCNAAAAAVLAQMRAVKQKRCNAPKTRASSVAGSWRSFPLFPAASMRTNHEPHCQYMSQLYCAAGVLQAIL
jgi:hypothetical protein